MKRILLLLIFVPFLALLTSCNEWVTNVDPLINSVSDNVLNSPDQVPFVTKGVKQALSDATDLTFTVADLLSDEFIFNFDIPSATFIQFQDIDRGDIVLDNFDVRDVNQLLGRLRFYADDLIRRVNTLSGIDPAAEKEARFVGNFYGGIARFWVASFLGFDKQTGGVSIDNSTIMTNNQAYDQAIEKMKAALPYATDYQKRVVNTFIARCYLYKGDYTNAATYATNGMMTGDTPFQALYTNQNANYYNIEVGSQRDQLALDPRFKAYVVANPTEAGRVALGKSVGASGTTYYRQQKYLTNGAPINLATWQENDLMRAELILRGAMAGDALGLVNGVRASHNVSAAVSVVLINSAAPNDPNITSIYTERDKELFTTGTRMPDQHRFNEWHLAAGKWRYLPLDQSERDYNPNLK